MFASITDRCTREWVRDRIDGLVVVPELPRKAFLGELKGYRSPRAIGQGDRIVYRVHPACGAVLVVAMGRRVEGAREDIYRLAQRLLPLRLLEQHILSAGSTQVAARGFDPPLHATLDSCFGTDVPLPVLLHALVGSRLLYAIIL